MNVSVKIQGVKKIMSRLKKASQQSAKGTEVGVKRAALFLQRESQILCPIEWGNLRNSAFTRPHKRNKGGFGTVMEVGYTASYAIFVHENLDAWHNPPTQAKFLEQPYRDKKSEMVKIIAQANKEFVGK